MSSVIDKPAIETTPSLMGVRKLAKLFGVHEQTIRTWVREGKFPQPSVVVGRTHRWTLESVTGFINNNKAACGDKE